MPARCRLGLQTALLSAARPLLTGFAVMGAELLPAESPRGALLPQAKIPVPPVALTGGLPIYFVLRVNRLVMPGVKNTQIPNFRVQPFG
jgi:hypothetical protein